MSLRRRRAVRIAPRPGVSGVVLVLLWLAAPVAAQTPPTVETPAAPAAAPAAPSLPVLEFIPLGEISGRAKRASEELREFERSLGSATLEKTLEADLVRLAERIEPGSEEVASELVETPSMATLAQLRTEWQGLERQVAERAQKIEQRIALLQQESGQLGAARDLWKRTAEKSRVSQAPETVFEAIDAGLAEVERGTHLVEGMLNDALLLQSQYAELQAVTQQTLAVIDDTRERVVDNLLVRDEPALWDEDFAPQLTDMRQWSPLGVLARLRDESILYARQHPDAVALHALCFILLGWALVRARIALRLAAPEGTDPEDDASPAAGARLTTRHPIAAAAVLTVFATPFFHDDPPRMLVVFLRLLLVFPLVLVLRPLLGRGLSGPLFLLSGFYLADRLRELFTGAPAPGRVLFAAEMTTLALLLTWWMYRQRLERLPASMRGNRWLVALGLWIRVAAVGAGVAALASVAGYTRFAGVVGGAVLGSGYAALLFYALVRIFESLAAAVFGGPIIAPIRMLDRHRSVWMRRTRGLLRVAGITLWAIVVLRLLALDDPLQRGLGKLFGTSFGYGGFRATLGGIVAFVVTLVVAWLVSRAVRFVLDEEVFPRVALPRGVPFALSTLARYVVLIVGFLIGLSALGFDLDRITILLGAFGVGIGFGLQNVVSNFVSGLILLFERPVKVGDSVELAGLEGNVQRIGIRASTLRTGDGADVIVPNSALISERVMNWTLSDRLRRTTLPIGVAYGNDPQRVIDLLRGVAEQHPGVCAYPKPVAVFLRFGENALEFEVRVWTDEPDDLLLLRSGVAIAIYEALREAGIDIPHPQRDLHLRSVGPRAAAALRGELAEAGAVRPGPDGSRPRS